MYMWRKNYKKQQINNVSLPASPRLNNEIIWNVHTI